MARRTESSGTRRGKTADYRHTREKRTNIPPAKIAAEGSVPKLPKARYEYSPHLPPVLRSDPTGSADRLPDLIAEAGRRPLKPEEQRLLAEALCQHEPWLEWAAKREEHEKGFFDVDPVALHIHERVSAQAVVRAAMREDVQRSLFADPQFPYQQAVQFYRHNMDWTNRLILGDCLQVMSSLARRENLAGKVQMIYIDPPYAINYKSNFQPQVGSREVKDKDSDLTREAEVVSAYRDTWRLGVHSYLSYLRDRLKVARELLSDGGSIFVQIGEENAGRVRTAMEEIFGARNAVVTIIFKKKGATTPTDPVNDFLLWFAKDRDQLKVPRLYEERAEPEEDPKFNTLISPLGEHWRPRDRRSPEVQARLRAGWQWARVNYPLVSQDYQEERSKDFHYRGRSFGCGRDRHWSFDPEEGLSRLANAERLFDGGGDSLGGIVHWNDWSWVALSNLWDDLHGEQDVVYAVQTNRKVLERCILMTTQPGDLVLDPTCGSGTTAHIAEQFGRRWITIDTSRVAIAIARQRLLTARFEHYQTKGATIDGSENPGTGFEYKKAPHISLKDIAQNTNLDPILSRHEPMLEEALAAANRELNRVTDELRNRLAAKLAARERAEGKRAVTDGDRRRWLLPKKGGKWRHWDVPFDSDPDWPMQLQEAVTSYRGAWRAKMAEVNACIAANADRVDLVDKPAPVPGVIRVSGPHSRRPTARGIKPG
jgi:adenine-specific DNA-methyltransferase